MTQVMAVSKPGINVGTATVPNDFIYNSQYNTLKYYTGGTTNVVVNRANYYGTAPGFFGGTVYLNIAYATATHNLGYYPFYTAFVRLTDTKWHMCPQYYGDFIYFGEAEAFASTSNLQFMVHYNTNLNTGYGTTSFIYKIFRNNLGL